MKAESRLAFHQRDMSDPRSTILRHMTLTYILGTIEFMSAEETQSTAVSVPPYHIAGISAIRVLSMLVGVWYSFEFLPEAWLEQQRKRNTGISCSDYASAHYRACDKQK